MGVKQYLLFIVTALLLVGCENISVNFLPLAAGNSWQYQLKIDEQVVAKESITITKELSPSKNIRRFKVQEPRALAIWVEEGRSIARATKHESGIIIKHPPFVNSAWNDYTKDGRVIYCRVIERGPVRAPAGEFPDVIAIHRELEDRSLILTQWYAADVGMIRYQLERMGKKPVVGELVEYDLK